MGLLLYKSNEMFSATELIRKSKMIFDKVVNNEIDKAIILRDGKPGFLLMDFVKYEKIMAEYEELKSILENNNLNPKQKEKVKPVKVKKHKIVEKEHTKKDTVITNIVEKPQHIMENETIKDKITNEEKTIEIVDNRKLNKPAFVTPPRPKPEVIIEEELEEVTVDDKINNQKEIKLENDTVNQTASIDDEELKVAMDRLKSMNLDDDMRAVAEQRIKERLQIAREERAKLLIEQEKKDKEELKEELELQVHIKEENKKKERELKEFWD